MDERNRADTHAGGSDHFGAEGAAELTVRGHAIPAAVLAPPNQNRVRGRVLFGSYVVYGPRKRAFPERTPNLATHRPARIPPHDPLLSSVL